MLDDKTETETANSLTLEELEAELETASDEIESPKEDEVEPKAYDFDTDYQRKIVALLVRDTVFNQLVDGLIKPEYFTSDALAALAVMGLKYYGTYKQAMNSRSIVLSVIKKSIATKVVKASLQKDILAEVLLILNEDLSGREYVVESVAEFAQHQALESAIIQSADLLSKGKFGDIRKLITSALDISASIGTGEYNYFEEIENRTTRRKELLSGAVRPSGITTGHPKLDGLLLHKGWGRRELTVIMGGAKSGKTTALVDFARAAAFDGQDVLYCTLEVSTAIIADRLDANIADTVMSELSKNIMDVETKVKAHMASKVGRLIFEEFPTGTMRASDLRRLISRYRAKGIKFDLVVVDYADIMAPEYRSDSAIENSKNIYVDLRAIAQTEDVAMLTATQTNREGYKAIVAKAEHASDDFNKIRIADLVISINATEEERADKEARLYFAASRNQRGQFTVKIAQDLEKMKFIKSILHIE